MTQKAPRSYTQLGPQASATFSRVPATPATLCSPASPSGLSRLRFCDALSALTNSYFCILRASLVAQMVKNLPAVQETQYQSLGQEDPLEREMTTHSNVLTWRIPWTEVPGGLQPMGSQKVTHDSSLQPHNSSVFLGGKRKLDV